MNADSHEIKFTDGLEREMIQREIDDINEFIGNTREPLLTWILAFAISVGTLFIVIYNGR